MKIVTSSKVSIKLCFNCCIIVENLPTNITILCELLINVKTLLLTRDPLL